MESSYNLLSETEPSEVQLHLLMCSVLEEVKAKLSAQKISGITNPVDKG